MGRRCSVVGPRVLVTPRPCCQAEISRLRPGLTRGLAPSPITSRDPAGRAPARGEALKRSWPALYRAEHILAINLAPHLKSACPPGRAPLGDCLAIACRAAGARPAAFGLYSGRVPNRNISTTQHPSRSPYRPKPRPFFLARSGLEPGLAIAKLMQPPHPTSATPWGAAATKRACTSGSRLNLAAKPKTRNPGPGPDPGPRTLAKHLRHPAGPSAIALQSPAGQPPLARRPSAFTPGACNTATARPPLRP